MSHQAANLETETLKAHEVQISLKVIYWDL